MLYSNNLDKITKWMIPLYCLLAVGLQIQCTPIIKGVPLRFSTSDILVGLLSILIAYYMVIKKEIAPREMGEPWVWKWFLAFTLWLTVCLWWGYHISGTLHSWALVNKFIGWFTLAAYFFLGSFCGNRFSSFFPKLLRTLLITSWVISSYNIIGAFIVSNFDIRVQYLEYYRFVGFLENPNAYGLFGLCAVLLQLPYLQKRLLFSDRVHYFGLALNITTVFFTGSRTAMGALIIGFVFLCTKIKFKKQDLKTLWLTGLLMLFIQINLISVYNFSVVNIYNPITVGTYNVVVGTYNKVIALYGGTPYHGTPPAPLKTLVQNNAIGGKYQYVFQGSIWAGRDSGVKQRIDTTLAALKLWHKNPVMGAGLGGFLNNQTYHFKNIAQYELYFLPIDLYALIQLKILPEIPVSNAVVLTRWEKKWFAAIVSNGTWLKNKAGDLDIVSICQEKVPVNDENYNGLLSITDDNREAVNKFILGVTSDASYAPIMIHTTSLWLLTETGLVGVLLFTIFLFRLLYILYPMTKYKDVFLLGSCGILISFVAASLTTEVMYQRHIWFLIGLSLGFIMYQKKAWVKQDQSFVPSMHVALTER